jgi:hypothetical protein
MKFLVAIVALWAIEFLYLAFSLPREITHPDVIVGSDHKVKDSS